MKQFSNYIFHENEWWWGRSVTILHKEGIAMLEIRFSKDKPTTAYLANLSVFKSNRRCGLATELLSIADELIKKNDMSFVRVDIDRTSNEDWVYEWWKKMGFKVAGNELYVTEMIKFLK